MKKQIKIEPPSNSKQAPSKKVKLEVDLDSLTKQRNSVGDDKFGQLPLKKINSQAKITTPKRGLL